MKSILSQFNVLSVQNAFTDWFSKFHQAHVKQSWSRASSKDCLKVKDSITAKYASFFLFLIDRQSLSVN